MNKRKKIVAILAALMAAIMVLSLILSLIPVANAATSSELKKQINEMKEEQQALQEQKDALQMQYEENEDEILRLVNEKDLIEREVTILYAQVNLVNEQIAAYNLLIADKQDELEAALGLYNDLKEKNKERIRAMEEDNTLNYWSVIFAANSFFDLLDRLNMIEEIEASDRRRLEEMSEAAQLVAAAQEELEAEKAELEVTRAELDAMQIELELKRTDATELLNELIAKCAEIEGFREELEAMESKMLDEIAAAEAAYNEAKRQEYLAWLATSVTTTAPTTASTTAPTTAGGAGNATEGTGTTESTGSTTETTKATEATESTGSGGTSSAYWMLPCNYTKLTSPFGYRDAPTAGASSYHQGVDLAAPEGTPIYASRAGTVTKATSSSSAGNYVTINHGDGYSSVYMHMTHYVVKAGQSVSQGQLIGYVGSTGISTGNHLHFGISYNGTYVNPALYVNFY